MKKTIFKLVESHNKLCLDTRLMAQVASFPHDQLRDWLLSLHKRHVLFDFLFKKSKNLGAASGKYEQWYELPEAQAKHAADWLALQPGTVNIQAEVAAVFARLQDGIAEEERAALADRIGQTSELIWNGEPVLMTVQLADFYETTEKHLVQNFNNNRPRYQEGKHFYYLEGEELSQFRATSKISTLPLNVWHIYLWTAKGALAHAHSLNTNPAWEAYLLLIDLYYVEQKARQQAEEENERLRKENEQLRQEHKADEQVRQEHAQFKQNEEEILHYRDLPRKEFVVVIGTIIKRCEHAETLVGTFTDPTTNVNLMFREMAQMLITAFPGYTENDLRSDLQELVLAHSSISGRTRPYNKAIRDGYISAKDVHDGEWKITPSGKKLIWEHVLKREKYER